METVQSIEGYFKAKASYLVCKYSAVDPSTMSKNSYAVIASKFEAALQKEILFSLNKCECNKDIDLLSLLNHLLQISDKSRLLFMQINKQRIKNTSSAPRLKPDQSN